MWAKESSLLLELVDLDWAHLDNTDSSLYLSRKTLITSAKSLLPWNITYRFQGFGCGQYLEDHYSAYPNPRLTPPPHLLMSLVTAQTSLQTVTSSVLPPCPISPLMSGVWTIAVDPNWSPLLSASFLFHLLPLSPDLCQTQQWTCHSHPLVLHKRATTAIRINPNSILGPKRPSYRSPPCSCHTSLCYSFKSAWFVPVHMLFPWPTMPFLHPHLGKLLLMPQKLA